MRSIICFLLVVFVTVCANAQTIQLGVVKEYNEKSQKTPLSGVELNVRSASSAVSDKDGEFSLRFLTLKAGEKVNVRRIEKLGYEVFNKEAIEQWNLNPNTPFIIVMCKSDKFKRIRDNYEKVSSESYARQLKQEEATLAKLRADGKLKEEEYQKKVYELRETYETQLDNLDNYIDKFSRIDLSELSAVEQEIIELVQQGKIEEAIARYEEQDYLGKFKEESSNILEISQAIDRLGDVRSKKIQSRDSLFSKIERYINVLTLSGGQECLNKAAAIFKEVADCDTANVLLQHSVSSFLADKISDYKGSLVYASRAVRLAANGEQNSGAALAYSNYGTLMYRLSDYSNAKKYTEKAIAIYESQQEPDIDNLTASYSKLGNILCEIGEYDKALERYQQSLDILSGDEMVDSIAISYEYNGIGGVYTAMGQYEKAHQYIKKALDIRLNNAKDKELIASSYAHVGIIEENLGLYEQAMQHLQQALDIYIELFGPIHFEVADTYGLIAKVYKALDEFDKAMEYYNKALAIEKEILYEIDDNLAELYNNMASIYSVRGDYDKALELYQNTLTIQRIIFGDGHATVANSYNNIAYTYSEKGELDKALEYYLR